MRTTLQLDDDVYQLALSLSRTSRISLGKAVSNLVRRNVTQRNKSRPKKGGFPVFDVPKDAPMVPASVVQKLWDEEGLG